MFADDSKFIKYIKTLPKLIFLYCIIVTKGSISLPWK